MARWAADPSWPAHLRGSHTSQRAHSPSRWHADANQQDPSPARGGWLIGRSTAPGRHEPATLHHVGVVNGDRLDPIHQCHHRRHRVPAPEFSHHGLGHGGIDERLIPLHIDHGGLLSHRGYPIPGELHQRLGNRGNTFAAGAALGGRHQHAKAQAFCQNLKLSAVGAQHQGIDAEGLPASLQHQLNHQLVTDVRQNPEPCWTDETTEDGRAPPPQNAESSSVPELHRVIPGAEPLRRQRPAHHALLAEPGATEGPVQHRRSSQRLR